MTLTEQLLLDLARFVQAGPPGTALDIIPTGHADEKLQGTDFELWLQTAKATASAPAQFLGYSIQAKKAYEPRGHGGFDYKMLGHTVKLDNGTDEYQYNVLLQYSKAKNTMAFHLFYHRMTVVTSSSFQPGRPGLYGCAVIPTPLMKAIRDPHSTNRVDSYARYERPWSSLFQFPQGPGVVGGPPSTGGHGPGTAQGGGPGAPSAPGGQLPEVWTDNVSAGGGYEPRAQPLPSDVREARIAFHEHRTVSGRPIPRSAGRLNQPYSPGYFVVIGDPQDLTDR